MTDEQSSPASSPDVPPVDRPSVPGQVSAADPSAPDDLHGPGALAPGPDAPTVTAADPIPPGPPPAASAGVGTRKRTLLTALAGAVAGAAIVGGMWAITANTGPDADDTFTLIGVFALTDGSSIQSNGDGCYGTGGYDDIAEGTSVTVYDATGTTVATGNLGESKLVPDTSGLGRSCRFDVSVPDVPKGSRFYSVEISHRGKVQMSAEEAEQRGFATTLG